MALHWNKRYLPLSQIDAAKPRCCFGASENPRAVNATKET